MADQTVTPRPARRLRGLLSRLVRSRAGRDRALLDAVLAQGADYASASLADGRGIGYASASRTLLVAAEGPAGIAVEAFPLAQVREVTGHVEPDTGPVPVPAALGPAAFAGVGQASGLALAARREAVLRSGLSIALAEGAAIRVCLDADPDRLRRWQDILRDAVAGRLAAPAAPVIL